MAIEQTLNLVLRPDIDVKYYLREYDDCMMGRRKSFSSAMMAKGQGPHLCAELLRLIFQYYMHWTPVRVRDILDKRYIDALHIEPLINRIPCPPEVNPKKEFYYVAWYLYPETVNVKPAELIIKLYMDVVNGNLVKFPKGYFDGNLGYIRARLLFLTMVREFLPKFESLEAMYAYFASEKGRQCINAYKLSVPLRELYGSPLAYMHDSLAGTQKDEDLYEKYSANVKRSKDDTFIQVGRTANIEQENDFDAGENNHCKDGGTHHEVCHYAEAEISVEDTDG